MGFLDLFKKRPRQRTPAQQEDPLLFDEEFVRKLDSLVLVSRRASSGHRRGERRSKKRGAGMEFADHRPYTPGDDIRALDVGTYQRLGKLLVRLYEEEEDRSVSFILDCSASMGTGGQRKFRAAQRLTAALAYLSLAQLDRVSLSVVRDSLVQSLPALRGKQRIFRIFRFLQELRPEGKTDFHTALRTFVAQQKRRGPAVLVTDLFDPQGFEDALNLLRFHRFEVVVLHIWDPLDAQPAQLGEVRVQDVETEATVELILTERVAEQLRAGLRETEQRARQFCVARAIPYFALSVELSLEETLTGILRQGGLLR